MANSTREKLIQMLNKALELEHAARIQYLAHAENVNGLYAEEVEERLKEIASDEAKHEGMYRNLLGNYLGVEPSMGLAPTQSAKEISAILNVNVKAEKEAIDFYKQIYDFVIANKGEFKYEFETLEHEIRHIIVEEQEHVIELQKLMSK